jgi:hypothetical protein
VTAMDATGRTAAQTGFSLSAMAHQSFTVGQLFPSLSPSFRGTVTIATTPPTDFVARTLSGDGVEYSPAILREA